MNIKKYIQEAITPRTQVGYLTIRGLMEDSSFHVKKIHKFLKDPNIKALFLKISSPGGLPGTSQALFNELNKFKKEKPVVALIENVCASAAYYAACASNHVICAPSALVGSIGVFLTLPNIKELLEGWKIKFDFVQTGKFKTAGSPLRDSTPEELLYLQKISDDTYNQFIKDVAQSRNLDLQKHKVWADGKVFTGNQALKLNLIDQLGSRQDAIDTIKKLANIETEIKFVKPKQPSGLMRLFGTTDDENSEGPEFSSHIATFLSNVWSKFVARQVG